MFTSTFQHRYTIYILLLFKELEFKIPQRISLPRNVCFNSFSWGHTRGHFILHLGKKLLTGLVLFTHKKGWGVHFSLESVLCDTFWLFIFCNSQSRKRQLKSQNCGSQADIFLCQQYKVQWQETIRISRGVGIGVVDISHNIILMQVKGLEWKHKFNFVGFY